MAGTPGASGALPRKTPVPPPPAQGTKPPEQQAAPSDQASGAPGIVASRVASAAGPAMVQVAESAEAADAAAAGAGTSELKNTKNDLDLAVARYTGDKVQFELKAEGQTPRLNLSEFDLTAIVEATEGPEADIDNVFAYLDEQGVIEEGLIIDLQGSRLDGLEIEDWDLRGANLQEASCVGTNFSNSQLGGTMFRRADCTDANFSWANLDDGTSFAHATVTGANFDGTEIIERELDGETLGATETVELDLDEAVRTIFGNARGMDAANDVPEIWMGALGLEETDDAAGGSSDMQAFLDGPAPLGDKAIDDMLNF